MYPSVWLIKTFKDARASQALLNCCYFFLTETDGIAHLCIFIFGTNWNKLFHLSGFVVFFKSKILRKILIDNLMGSTKFL